VQPEIGPFKTFGAMLALAFLACGLVAARRFKELGKPVDWAYEIIGFAIVGGIVGAKVYYLIENPGEISLSGLLGGTGLVFYGGALGGVIAGLIWAWWRGFLNGFLLDMGAVGLPLGLAIGRIGCQLSGDGDYGPASSLPWAMAFPNGEVPTNEEVHPTPIYETIAAGMIAWVLWRLRDRFKPGVLFPAYLVLQGIERFLIEFVRRTDEVAAGLTAAQFQSIGLVLIGLVWIAIFTSRNGGTLRPAPA